uniref:Uncharacterized protein n=1 Tax=Arundo donax TaxID=35708 RepID=A0A0A9ERH8_ARUDO
MHRFSSLLSFHRLYHYVLFMIAIESPPFSFFRAMSKAKPHQNFS